MPSSGVDDVTRPAPPSIPSFQKSTMVVVAVPNTGTEIDSDADEDSSVLSTNSNNNNAYSDPHSTLVTMVQQQHHEPSMSHEHRGQALAYLLNYETMVRQQEAEDMAVLAHIRPCVTRLMQLISSTSTVPVPTDHQLFLQQQVTLTQLRRAIAQLEQRMKSDQEQQRVTEFLTTDRQLVMVLKLLSSVASDTDVQDDISLTWAEFIQCYKVCIAGMVTLQHLPVDGANDTTDATQRQARARARDRTMAMLRLFAVPHAKFKNGSITTETSGKVVVASSSSTLLDKEPEVCAPLTQVSHRGSRSFDMKLLASDLLASKSTPKVWTTRRSMVFVAACVLLSLCAVPYMFLVNQNTGGRDTTKATSLPMRRARSKPLEKIPSLSFVDKERFKARVTESPIAVKRSSTVATPERHASPRTTPLAPTTAVITSGSNTPKRPLQCEGHCRSFLGIWSTFM